ncbi:MAG: MBL fold metallo-hydrolase [Gammaproteobacteria bacterium]|jgi:hydroxyacylglutathione hydrolase|nr:MBL fold metallo-hydrolase [Gammaproteobacteria bacterium]MBT7370605.1 MBL fold metallo-hydrolase [Gammaproteobacteria bacterium]
MRPEEINPADLENRDIGPVTLLFGFENGKYPYGNSMLITGEKTTVMIDPCLGIVARKGELPSVDMVLHSHTHEDHIAGTHLFMDAPWYAHESDALGLESIDGLMEMYGLAGGEEYEGFKLEVEKNFYYPHDGKVLTFKDGDRFDLGGVTLDVIHTPGHTRGHCCFVVEWGDSAAERLVYLGDIELTGFGPYYGDAWSDLTEFEESVKKLPNIDAEWWLTFHHKGLIESRDRFLTMLGDYMAVIGAREQRLLAFISEPRSLDEIVDHRCVYRPGQTGWMVDQIERRSMGMHLERLLAQGVVIEKQGRYQVQDRA